MLFTRNNQIFDVKKNLPMKSIIISVVFLFVGLIASAQNAGILMPEMSQVLYRNYDNKIVPVIPGLKDVIITVNGGTATKSTWTTNGIPYNGYLVRPTGGTNTVTITCFGKNAKGENVKYVTQSYRVLAFPKPTLLNESISKNTGARLSVGFDESISLLDSFNVTGGQVTFGNNPPLSFTGSVLPAELLKDAKVGQSVAIIIKYNRIGSESTNNIKGIITISE
jgi:hypothetical protein